MQPIGSAEKYGLSADLYVCCVRCYLSVGSVLEFLLLLSLGQQGFPLFIPGCIIGNVCRLEKSRRAMLATGILTVFTVVFVVWVLLSGNMAIRYQENGFVIDASGWGDYKVNYKEIESIDYEPNGIQEGENDRRTNGFGNLKMAMGRFYNDSLGDYIRYTFHDCESCVVLQVNGETVVINGEDEAATEKIYNTLKDKCEELQTALS